MLKALSVEAWIDMSESNLYIKGIEQLIITKVQIHKKVNEHGSAYICGQIKEEDLKEFRNYMLSNQSFEIKAKDSEEVTSPVFYGVMYDYTEKHQSQYCEVELSLVGKTYQMDVKENKRVFQNVAQTYESIIREVSKEYGDCVQIYESELLGSIGHMSLQYGETDWAYIRRLASEKNASLIPYGTAGNISIGLFKSGTAKNVKVSDYQRTCSMKDYEIKTAKGINTSIAAEEYYTIKTRENMDLGDPVNIEGVQRALYVYEIKGVYEGYQLENTYILKHEEAFQVGEMKNYDIVGVSIAGKVQSVLNDKVTVLMEMEGNQDSLKLMEFATVYSSDNNAGWYCMPEEGDLVRVFFPNEDADQAFVMNSMQIQKEDKDPKIKFFRNPQGKEIVFAPEYIKIANSKGMEIIMDDTNGISIKSILPINIVSDGEVKVESILDKVTVKAESEINLKQGNSFIDIGEDISMSASQIHMQQFE